ncbi:hypothetical protein N7507_003778 [Penicillium longicatenatum]|nr:hypothetical protein N7507_003778 [Penicillium longicatenatum]
MANPPRTQQVPQHVTALLSHLTSRPGNPPHVQHLQPANKPHPLRHRPRSRPSTNTPSLASRGPSRAHLRLRLKRLRIGRLALEPYPSVLGCSPPSTSTPALDGESDYGNGSRTPREEDRDENTDREEDEEVKLLRMRTRKHEIVVVPDRKYLLCVVHDASHASGGPGARGTRSSR